MRFAAVFVLPLALAASSITEADLAPNANSVVNHRSLQQFDHSTIDHKRFIKRHRKLKRRSSSDSCGAADVSNSADGTVANNVVVSQHKHKGNPPSNGNGSSQSGSGSSSGNGSSSGSSDGSNDGSNDSSSDGASDSSSSSGSGSSSDGSTDNGSSSDGSYSSGSADSESNGGGSSGSGSSDSSSTDNGSTSDPSSASSDSNATSTSTTALSVSQFTGTNTGIGSWFRTDNAADSTNGRSWCQLEYQDDWMGFAPDVSTLLNSEGGNYNNAGKAYCGLEAIATNPNNGNTATIYIVDGFDPKWVRTPGSIDLTLGAFKALYGSETSNKDIVIQNLQWKLTGNRNSAYAFNA